MQFPNGPFKIEMIRGVFGIGRRVDKGEVLRAPQDISREMAIRWCTRRKPFAKLIRADSSATSDLRNAPAGYKVDVSAAQEEMSSDGHIDAGTHDDPEANVPALESLSYRELQALAKERGIKYVGVSRDDLIVALSLK